MALWDKQERLCTREGDVMGPARGLTMALEKNWGLCQTLKLHIFRAKKEKQLCTTPHPSPSSGALIHRDAPNHFSLFHNQYYS